MGRWEQRREERHQGHARDRVPAPAPDGHAGLVQLAATIGNQAFSVLARDGAGLLPGGAVHPEVEQAIARTRGGGNQIDHGVRDRLAGALGDPFTDVRVHTDNAADALSRSVAARAFTTGSDIYFASGEYRPGSSDGDRLLAHELTHVVQQRGASTSGPLSVTEPGDAFEREADAASEFG
jgi:hypothetical protein